MDVSKTSTHSRAVPRGKKARWAAILLVMLVVIVVAWFVLRPGRVKLGGAQQAVVMQGDLQPNIEVLGTIRPINIQTVPAQTAGRIINIDVDPGQAVKKGATLLVMANDEAQSDLATARMKYAEARSRVDVARAQADSDVASSRSQLFKAKTAEAYARSQYRATLTVSKSGVVSRMQLEEMKSKLDMAAADTGAAASALSSAHKVSAAKLRGQVEESNVLKQELDRHQQHVEELVVRAPTDGFIAERNAEAGTNVSTGTPLLTFVDNSGYYVQLNVPEDAAQEVQVGDAVSVSVGNRKLHAVISRIAPLSKKGYVRADATFPEKEKNLPSIDSTVQVRVHSSVMHNVLYIRAPTGINGSITRSVLVVKPGRDQAIRQKVSFGTRVGEFVTVLGGLAKGDRILMGVDKTNDSD